jgi:hypothetical protein
MPKIVDTSEIGYPMIEGIPFTDYKADEVFVQQMNKYFPDLFNFEIISRRGSTSRTDALLKLTFKSSLFSNNHFFVYTFILYEGGKGRAHDDELRTQLTSCMSWNPNLNNFKPATNFRDSTEGTITPECYCIGIYKQNPNTDDVAFVGMPSEVLCKSENEKINPTSTFQTYGEKVREAYLHGLCLHEKSFTASGSYNLLNFKPQFFLWYMKHRDEIHVKDIDKALNIIKSSKLSDSILFSKSFPLKPISFGNSNKDKSEDSKYYSQYLRAMRTKPFLLLAGISGTGKSRIVKQMAFDSCQNIADLQADETTPGNYSLIEVKPNWHDSSELIGYESHIGKNPHYVTTPFIRFLVKAMFYEEQGIPFFVCLDEMNLAPVEQYFAEFLSVLESRKVVEGKITSEALIPAEIFKTYGNDLAADLFGLQKKQASYPGVSANLTSYNLNTDQIKVFDRLKEKGLRIPSNLIVIGTVNMDETTHQFSRKVIDRAMTIEMNLPEENPFDMFFSDTRDLEYTESPIPSDHFLPSIVKAADAIKILENENAEMTNWLKKEVAKVLTGINSALDNTPFKVAYRVQNELVLYFYELQREYKASDWWENKFEDWQKTLNESVDQILMMKVLPRVEGDDVLLDKPMERLEEFCAPYKDAAKKVKEMRERLDKAQFTSFWP